MEEHGPDKLWADVLWIRMLFGDPIMRKGSTIAYFCTGDIAVLFLLEGILCFAWCGLNRRVCEMKKLSHYYFFIWIFFFLFNQIKLFYSKLCFLFITEHHCWYMTDTEHGLHVQKEVCCMWLGRGHLRFLGQSTANASLPASTQHSAVVAPG